MPVPCNRSPREARVPAVPSTRPLAGGQVKRGAGPASWSYPP